MTLKPVDVKRNPRRSRRGDAQRGKPKSPVFAALVDLKRRTINNAETDPLRRTDWWAQIDPKPRTAEMAARRVWDIKNKLMLPEGWWTIRTHWISDTEKVIVARFEGVEHPEHGGWERASEQARRTRYAACVPGSTPDDALLQDDGDDT